MNPRIITALCNDLKNKSPLIHCITNPISINQCANAVLALGARPIMAEHPEEAEEITQTANAAIFNIGNITDVRMRSISISASCCAQNGIPFVIDIVGMACSSLRRNFIKKLLTTQIPSVIKGNYSEIKSLYGGYTAQGIDSEILAVDELESISIKLSKKYNTVIFATGKTDIITDGKKLLRIKNGTAMLCSTTGTGCMSGALCGAFLAVGNPLEAAAASAAVMGICGELALADSCTHGTGSFLISLMDSLSTISEKNIEKKLKMGENSIENRQYAIFYH